MLHGTENAIGHKVGPAHLIGKPQHVSPAWVMIGVPRWLLSPETGESLDVTAVRITESILCARALPLSSRFPVRDTQPQQLLA